MTRGVAALGLLLPLPRFLRGLALVATAAERLELAA